MRKSGQQGIQAIGSTSLRAKHPATRPVASLTATYLRQRGSDFHLEPTTLVPTVSICFQKRVQLASLKTRRWTMKRNLEMKNHKHISNTLAMRSRRLQLSQLPTRWENS